MPICKTCGSSIPLLWAPGDRVSYRRDGEQRTGTIRVLGREVLGRDEQVIGHGNHGIQEDADTGRGPFIWTVLTADLSPLPKANFSVSEEWILKAAEKENCGIISAGGLVTMLADEDMRHPPGCPCADCAPKAPVACDCLSPPVEPGSVFHSLNCSTRKKAAPTKWAVNDRCRFTVWDIEEHDTVRVGKIMDRASDCEWWVLEDDGPPQWKVRENDMSPLPAPEPPRTLCRGT